MAPGDGELLVDTGAGELSLLWGIGYIWERRTYFNCKEEGGVKINEIIGVERKGDVD